MKKNILWITRTAVLLALLVTLQYLTKGFGQIVTGSCVNAILAVAALAVGLGSGMTVALISPVLAYLLGIAPQILVVPAIMIGNALFVSVLWAVASRPRLKIVGAIGAAVVKAAALYLIVAKVVCGLLASSLLASGALKEPMLQALPATFSWPQLVTALIGVGAALAIVPLLKNITLNK